MRLRFTIEPLLHPQEKVIWNLAPDDPIYSIEDLGSYILSLTGLSDDFPPHVLSINGFQLMGFDDPRAVLREGDEIMIKPVVGNSEQKTLDKNPVKLNSGQRVPRIKSARDIQSGANTARTKRLEAVNADRRQALDAQYVATSESSDDDSSDTSSASSSSSSSSSSSDESSSSSSSDSSPPRNRHLHQTRVLNNTNAKQGRPEMLPAQPSSAKPQGLDGHRTEKPPGSGMARTKSRNRRKKLLRKAKIDISTPISAQAETKKAVPETTESPPRQICLDEHSGKSIDLALATTKDRQSASATESVARPVQRAKSSVMFVPRSVAIKRDTQGKHKEQFKPESHGIPDSGTLRSPHDTSISSLNQKAPVNSTRSPSSATGQDDDIWKSRISLDAVECSGKKIKLSSPTFPFKQGLGPVRSQVKKRKRESPVASVDVASMPNLSLDCCTPGSEIAFKKLEVSEETGWAPRISDYQRAKVQEFDQVNGSIELSLIDPPRKQIKRDEHGNRVYSKFEMPEEDGEDDDNSSLRISFAEMIEPKLVKIAEIANGRGGDVSIVHDSVGVLLDSQNSNASFMNGNDSQQPTIISNPDTNSQQAAQKSGQVSSLSTHESQVSARISSNE